MPVFTYRAMNEDSKEVRGQVDALDLDSAKRALEATHLDVVEIHEASRRSGAVADAPTDAPSLKTTFAFEGKDTSGGIRRGTVQSETKYQAFEKLKNDQELFLTMLSPLGVTPQYRDNDLENWQKSAPPPPIRTAPSKPSSPSPAKSVSAQPLKQGKPKSIGFAETASTPPPQKSVSQPVAPSSHQYHPLASTLRLYAGWLLAWYGLFVALGYYAHTRALPWDLPFVEAFFVSPLIFSFTVAIFLFLMLGSIHRAVNGHWTSRIVLGLLGIGALVGVRMSVV